MKENNKEAIDIVKQMIADGQLSQYVAEKYFPEIKESEDEKIKKAISYILNNTDYGLIDKTDFTVSEMIAWLEKQGEQKSYASETMDEKGDFDDGFTRMMEKEQKPVELSDGDKHILSLIDEAVHDYWPTETYEKINDWLGKIHIHNSQGCSKENEDNICTCAKWSEEDEVHLRELEGLVKERWRKAENDGDLFWMKKMSDLSFFLKTMNPSKANTSLREGLEDAAKEWDRNAYFSPIAMTLDENGNPNGTEQFTTTHEDSFKAGANYIIEKLIKSTTPQLKIEWHEKGAKANSNAQVD